MSTATRPVSGQEPDVPGGLQVHGWGCESAGKYIFKRIKKLAEISTFPAKIDADTGAHCSHSELLRSSVRAALGLRAQGLSAGDVLAVFSRDDLFTVALGALFEGITVCCLEPTWREEELRPALLVVRPRLFLSDAKRLPIAKAAASGGPQGITHVLTGRTGKTPAIDDGVVLLHALVDIVSDDDAEVDAYVTRHIVDLQDHIAMIDFTSGSTGRPKAVAHSNYSLLMGSLQHPALWQKYGCYPGVRFKLNKSMAWSIDLLDSLVCTVSGATRVAMNEKSANHTLEMVEKYKVNTWIAIPSELHQLAAAARLLAADGRRPDLRTVRTLMSCGAQMSAAAQDAVMRDLGLPVVQMYGSTEMYIVTSDTTPPTVGSSGTPLEWVQIKIVNLTTGHEITETGESGELLVKTPGAFTCYMSDPEATKAAFDEDGFFRTGDMAFRNAEGKLFMSDRAKQVFKYDCFQVSPVEIESILLEHIGVQEVCVGGRPHAWLGHAPTALVVRRSGCCVDPTELQGMVEARLSDPKHLRGGVLFVEDLPRTRTGKIDRVAVAERLTRMPIELGTDMSVKRPTQHMDD